jgi:hypothetical protein
VEREISLYFFFFSLFSLDNTNYAVVVCKCSQEYNEMAVLLKKLETKPVEYEKQLVIVHSQRFNKVQWDHLVYMQGLTGCHIPEYIRRLVDADRHNRGKK